MLALGVPHVLVFSDDYSSGLLCVQLLRTLSRAYRPSHTRLSGHMHGVHGAPVGLVALVAVGACTLCTDAYRYNLRVAALHKNVSAPTPAFPVSCSSFLIVTTESMKGITLGSTTFHVSSSVRFHRIVCWLGVGL